MSPQIHGSRCAAEDDLLSNQGHVAKGKRLGDAVSMPTMGAHCGSPSAQPMPGAVPVVSAWESHIPTVIEAGPGRVWAVAESWIPGPGIGSGEDLGVWVNRVNQT